MVNSARKNLTQKDIARKLGVSLQTVSMAVNGTGRLSDEMRQRVLDMAKRMNYIPNAAARALVYRKAFLFGVMMPYMSQSFFGHILAGIEERAKKNSFAILIGNNDPASPKDSEQSALDLMALHKVDGIITVPGIGMYHAYKALYRQGFPIVQIMQEIPRMNHHYVLVDNIAGGRIAADLLISNGNSRIGMLSVKARFSGVCNRRLGFFQRLREEGLEDSIEEMIPTGASDVDAADLALERLLKKQPSVTAVFCASDYLALGALRAAKRLKIRVPEDLEIVGFDDMNFASLQGDLRLTTIAQPKEEIGRRAADMLCALLTGQEVVPEIIRPSLVIRETTRGNGGVHASS